MPPSYLSSPRVSADEALEQTSLRQTWGCWLDGGLADERGLADEGVGAFNRVLGGGTNMAKNKMFLLLYSADSLLYSMPIMVVISNISSRLKTYWGTEVRSPTF